MIGETPVTGGICGCFFFVDKTTVATANHVLNKRDFKPNDGFANFQFWLLLRFIPIVRSKTPILLLVACSAKIDL